VSIEGECAGSRHKICSSNSLNSESLVEDYVFNESFHTGHFHRIIPTNVEVII